MSLALYKACDHFSTRNELASLPGDDLEDNDGQNIH